MKRSLWLRRLLALTLITGMTVAAVPNNIANKFGLGNKIKWEKSNALYIGNGDDLGTSVISATFMGEPIIEAFNAGKLDVDTSGNHDFDMGPDQLTKLVAAINVKGSKTGASADTAVLNMFADKAAMPEALKADAVRVAVAGLIRGKQVGNDGCPICSR